MKTTIAIVDDHELLRNGLRSIIDSFEEYNVVLEAANGEIFKTLVQQNNIQPEIILLDINMPVMDGFETGTWIKKNLPKSRILVLSMLNSEEAVIRMLKNGARGYILKDSKPQILQQALNDIRNTGIHVNEMISVQLLSQLQHSEKEVTAAVNLTQREVDFLLLAASDLTYKDIADKMNIHPKTLENYRESLFLKLQVKSRVGLVLAGIKGGWIQI